MNIKVISVSKNQKTVNLFIIVIQIFRTRNFDKSFFILYFNTVIICLYYKSIKYINKICYE